MVLSIAICSNMYIIYWDLCNKKSKGTKFYNYKPPSLLSSNPIFASRSVWWSSSVLSTAFFKALLRHVFLVVLFFVEGPEPSGLDGEELDSDSELKRNLFFFGSLQGAGDLFTLIKSGFPSLVPASACIFGSSSSTSRFNACFSSGSR